MRNLEAVSVADNEAVLKDSTGFRLLRLNASANACYL
jgi:hypothetical protein